MPVFALTAVKKPLPGLRPLHASPQPPGPGSDPCTGPPSDMRETQDHRRTGVRPHLLSAWTPQREDSFSCPGNVPCLSAFPRTRTQGEAGAAAPSRTLSRDSDNHTHTATAGTRPCKPALGRPSGPPLSPTALLCLSPTSRQLVVWINAGTDESRQDLGLSPTRVQILAPLF